MGVTGGNLEKESIGEMTEVVTGLGEESAWTSIDPASGIGLSYSTRDPKGATTWEERTKKCDLRAITNLPALGLSHAEVFQRLLQNPGETAASLKEGFLAVCRDRSEDRYVLVTDKLDSRSALYSTDRPFIFATSVDAILDQMAGGELDLQAVSDMLLMGHLWGDRTLVEEITAMRPAHVLEVSEGTVSTHRYWRPKYEEHEPGKTYLAELTERYRRAVKRGQSTFSGEVGLWLSGGLDSRSTLAALTEGESDADIVAYTYDANPPLGINPDLATEVASQLGIDHRQVPLEAETFADAFERSIEAVDGMISWNTLQNLSTTYEVDDPPSIMMEGIQGELFGDHLLRPHLSDHASAVESQFASEASIATEKVNQILSSNVDPLTTFRDEAAHSPVSSVSGKIKDIQFQNYYSRKVLQSNRITRDRSEERVLQADGDLLEWCAKLPREYRKGAFLLGDTYIPYGTSRAKLGLMRRLSPSLANVTYERTRVKASLPYPVHVLGFFASVTYGRLRSKPTYGGGQLADFWVRDRDTQIHETVSGLVDDARRRSVFNEDAVVDIYESHMNGENNIALLARITTLELWLQNHLD